MLYYLLKLARIVEFKIDLNNIYYIKCYLFTQTYWLKYAINILFDYKLFFDRFKNKYLFIYII